MRVRIIVLSVLSAVLFLTGTTAGMFWYLGRLNVEADVKISSEVKTAVAEPASGEIEVLDAYVGEIGDKTLIGPNNGQDGYIDFDTYLEISRDVYAYLYIPGTYVSYPVMREFEVSPDEYYYLTRDMYGNKNTWGSILTPMLPENDLEDPHLLLFGHNMDDMDVGFTGLKSWYETEQSWEDYRYIYLYYPDRSEKWEVWAACSVKNTDMVYTLDYQPESREYKALIDHLYSTSVYRSPSFTKPDISENILVLSTCDGPTGTKNRFLVAAKLVDTLERK